MCRPLTENDSIKQFSQQSDELVMLNNTNGSNIRMNDGKQLHQNVIVTTMNMMLQSTFI